MSPGKHLLVCLDDNGDVVEAEFEAGKTYFVYLWINSAIVTSWTHINPLPPGSKHWKDKDRWIERSRLVELSPENTLAVKEKYLRRVRKALAKYDPNGPNIKRAIRIEYGISSPQ